MSVYNIKNALLWGICSYHFKSVNIKKPDSIKHLVLGILEAIPVLGQVVSLIEYSIVKLFQLNKTAQKAQKIAENSGIRTRQKSEGIDSSDLPKEWLDPETEEVYKLERIEYVKGETPTAGLGIRTKGQKFYGKGAIGEVKGVEGSETSVLKKGSLLEREFEIAQKIGVHPNFVRVEKLYVKSYSDTSQVKHKLLMEKIEGDTLTEYYRGHSKEKLSLEEVTSYLEMLKNCCLHLYSKGLTWKDVNSGNIMILDDKSSIKIIDFGFWSEVEDPEERAKLLFLGSLEVAGWMIKSSFVRAGSTPNRDNEYSIQYPEAFFGKKVEPARQVLSLHSHLYEGFDWMASFREKVKGKSDEEVMSILGNYFDCVIAAIQKQAESLK